MKNDDFKTADKNIDAGERSTFYSPQDFVNILRQNEQDREGPPSVMDRSYIPGFLSENIGKNVRAEFVLGNSQYVDKVGRLIEVGVNYFVLQDLNSNARIMADLYAVKFVTIFDGPTAPISF